MHKSIGLLVGFAGLTAVVLGAFGAHGLKPYLNTDQLNMWEKGVQYQFYHTVAIFACMLYLRHESSTLLKNASYCFSIGILFFSGSLYLLSTRHLTGIPSAFLGPVTPLGGLFFIAGWLHILVAAFRSEQKQK